MNKPEMDEFGGSVQALALMEEGTELLHTGDARQAFRCLERGWRLAVEIENPPVWILALGNLLVRACRALGRIEDIQRRAAELYKAGVRDPVVVEMRARACLAAGSQDDPDALEAYVMYIESADATEGGLVSELWSFLAVALEVDLEAAPQDAEHLRPYLERLHAARPRSVFPAWQLGRYHYLKDDFSSARHYLEKVTGHLASSPRLLNLRAACSERLGDHLGALDQYRRSLAQDPDQAHIHFRIGRVLLHAYLESYLPA